MTFDDYVAGLRTKPLPHQVDVLRRIRGRDAVGLWLDPGLGKSKIVLDWVTEAFWTGGVDALLVVAPNGVHQAWVEDEVAAHLDATIWAGAETFIFHASEVKTAKEARGIRKRLQAHPGLIIVTMSYSAVRTDRGGKLLATLVKNRRSCLVLDESTKIKSPGSKISRRLRAIGKHAPTRFALSGTPVTNSPFDLFAQLQFLDPDIWEGMNFGQFKHRYAEWETSYGPGGQKFPKLVGYRHLDELYDRLRLGGAGVRMAKEDAVDLPPKIYQRRYFELTGEQCRLIDELREELRVDIEDGEVTAPLVVQQLVRAQQITSGFVKDDDGQERDLKENPRLALLRGLLKDEAQQVIIWAKFRREVDAICQLLGDQAVRYDGAVKKASVRRRAIETFRRGDAQFFVANPAALSHGVTLTEAERVYYYSTGWKLEERLQSEDRCHRIGTTGSVVYVDLVGRGSVDAQILGALRRGRNLAADITGDEVLDWLAP